MSAHRTTLLAMALTLAATAVASAGSTPRVFRTAPTTLPAMHPPSSRWIQSHLQAYRRAPLALSGGSSSTTKPYPLNGPWGLTVAPNGNLYVANEYANQVLIYGTNLAQQTGNTITSGLDNPTSVAFDSLGRVYVSNISSSTITVYAPNRTSQPNFTLGSPSNIYRPASIAIDGLDDIYVDNNFGSIGVLNFVGYPLGSIPPNNPDSDINSITQRGHFLAYAGVTRAVLNVAVAQLQGIVNGTAGGNSGAYYAIDGNNVRSVTYDTSYNVYIATDDKVIIFTNLSNGAESTFAKLSFYPQGIAIDPRHNHLFVSDFYDNAIAVYALNSGALITTLH